MLRAARMPAVLSDAGAIFGFAAATSGRSAAKTGSGTNVASEAPGEGARISTGTVMGAKPARVKVTVKGASATSSIEHGVRQLQPNDVVASAPSGLESKRRLAVTERESGVGSTVTGRAGVPTQAITQPPPARAPAPRTA